MAFAIAMVVMAKAQVPFDPSTSGDGVDPHALRRHVEFLAGMDPPRSGSAPLARVADYIESEFQKGRGRVWRQAFGVDGETYYNVIAEFGPTPGEEIVVGAHYDSAYGNPGADDNASGVAAIIELTRLLDGTAFGRRVELVAFALEQAPRGAECFVRPEATVAAASLSSHLGDAGAAVTADHGSLEQVGSGEDGAPPRCP